MKLRDICVSFDGKRVIDGFSLDIPAGASICLQGPSGCGKTTLLNVMMGLIKPDSGLISGNHGVRLGVVFQEDRLIEHMSALENLLLVTEGRSKRREAEKALDALGLFDLRNNAVQPFSGGQKRRVAIARAMISRANLLLLDEPFKGLDKDTRMTTADYIREHTDGAALVVVTHDRDEALMLGVRDFVQMNAAPLQPTGGLHRLNTTSK